MITCITIIPLARNNTEHGKKKNAFECFGRTRGHHTTKIFQYLKPEEAKPSTLLAGKICAVLECQPGDILALTNESVSDT